MSVIAHGTGYRSAELQQVAMPRANQPALRRGVLFSHGWGAAVTAWSPQQYTDRGYPLFAGDLGASLTSAGNDDSITATGAAWTYMKTTAGGGVKTDKVLLLAASSGCLNVLNWAIQNPTLVQAIALVIPVLDLDDIYQNNKGGFRAGIGTAYGVTYPTAIPNLATHSPVAYSNANKALLAMPIKIWASDDDPIASATTASQTWATSVNGQGGNVTVTSMGAIGHTSNLPETTFIAFFDANGGRS